MAGRWHTARFDDASPVLVSEALRAGDLLVSVASFALGDEPGLQSDQRRWRQFQAIADRPLGRTAQMRRVYVGPYAVHLSTARVTRDGDPVTVSTPDRSPASPLPWLPYDERLLERVVHTVVTLATHLARSEPGV